MFTRKFTFQALIIIILFVFLISLLLVIQKPYGCDREDTNCLIEKGAFYKDHFICARAIYTDECYFKVAMKLNNSWPCHYVSDEGDGFTKEKCFDAFS